MANVKTLSKGQIVIPSGIRKKYHIEPGTTVQILEYNGIIYLVPPVNDAIKVACGALPSKPSLAKKLIQERKNEFR